MSRIITGNKTAEDLVREHLRRLQKQAEQPSPRRKKTAVKKSSQPSATVSSLDDYLILGDLSCVDADGNEFEKYGELYVAKDVVQGDKPYSDTNSVKQHINFTPYKGAVHFEKQGNGSFLPSMALSCNIIAVLYHQRSDPTVKAVLDQYKNHGSGYGWHDQNTIVDWKNGKIIHYPSDRDFPKHGENDKINLLRQQSRLPFSFAGNFRGQLLENALKDADFAKFVKNITGLQDPSVLVDLGTYFGKAAKVWVTSDPPKLKETRAAWLGCNDISFYLDAAYDLYGSSAARGVKFSP